MFKKLINIFITVTILISTTGFTISKHYCSGNLISVSVLSEAQSCCKGGEDCCKNETISVEPINELLFSSFSFDFLENFDFSINDFAIVISNYDFAFYLNKNYSEIGFSPHKLISIFPLLQVFRL